MSGRYDVRVGCALLCADVLGPNCILDVFGGGVLLRFLAAASTFSVTLSPGCCLSWRKAVSGKRKFMSIAGIVGDCIATSFTGSGLCCFSDGHRENIEGDFVTSRLAGADEIIDGILLVRIDAIVRPTVGIGVKTLEGIGKKLRQSSLLSVPSMCLRVSAVS